MLLSSIVYPKQVRIIPLAKNKPRNYTTDNNIHYHPFWQITRTYTNQPATPLPSARKKLPMHGTSRICLTVYRSRSWLSAWGSVRQFQLPRWEEDPGYPYIYIHKHSIYLSLSLSLSFSLLYSRALAHGGLAWISWHVGSRLRVSRAA